VLFSRHYQCAESENSCNCTAGLGLIPLEVCSPVTLVGPRGVWQSFTLTSGGGAGSTAWTVTPDGSVERVDTKYTVESPLGTTTTSHGQLSAEDLMALNAELDGPVVRLMLADPTSCPQVFDASKLFKLVLDTTTLEKEVVGCPGVLLQPLAALVQKY